ALAELENTYGSLILGAIKSRRTATNKPNEKKLAKRLCSFASGLATLPKALASRLKEPVTTSCQVLDITISKEIPYYKVKFQVDKNIEQISTNHLVLATPAYTTASFLESHLPKLANELKAIEYVPMAIVHLNVALSHVAKGLNGFGFLVPRSEKIRLLGSIWSSSLFPNRAPNGQALFTNFIGGAHDVKAVELGSKELGQIVAEELKKILDIKTIPNLVNVYKYQMAIPQYNLGHLSRLAIIESELRSQSNLYLASNYLKGVSVPDCVSRGKALATRIKAQFK
ncbi:MAG: protoporphyrinogen oxidase, partial [bacterium]